MMRWGFERAHSANIAGAKHPSGRPFRVEDFFISREMADRQAQVERDRADLLAAQIEHARQIRLMKEGKFDESILPKWARLTPEEKAARGMK